MNERIRELAEQAFFDEATSQSSNKMYTFSDHKMQQFADLIVQECAEVCRNWTSVEHIFTPDHMADLILDNFGVDK